MHTEFLETNSINYCDRDIADYAKALAAFKAWHDDQNHPQLGDSRELASLLLKPFALANSTDAIDEGLDVVIRGGEPSDYRLVSRRPGSFRICLVVAPSYLTRKGHPIKPADLVGHDCLHYR